MKLRPNDTCPIHKSRFCCGREFRPLKKSGKWIDCGNGIRKHMETGLVRRSPAAMRELLNKKVRQQLGECAICHLDFDDIREVVADHIVPRKMGGSARDDSEENIQAVHNLCNCSKGSKRL